MMPQNQETPEKALLNLIEKPGVSARGAAPPGKKKRSGFSLKALFGRKKPAAAAGPRGQRQVNLRVVNVLLVGGIIAVAVYLAASTFISLEEIEARLRVETPAFASTGVESVEDPFKMKDVEYYIARLEDRDIFTIDGRLTKEVEEEKKSEPSPKALDAAQNLRLVGISWSDDPDAMIEDVSRHMTFFLKKGDVMENGLSVKQIFKERVVLTLDGHEVELQ